MTIAGVSVLSTFSDIFLAYGQSDEYSFIFKKDTKIYNRRAEKILTCNLLLNKMLFLLSLLLMFIIGIRYL
jgi:tRNA(His) guanylyltransferase